MDLENIILSEVSQTEKDKHHIISLIWGIFKKKTERDTNEHIYNTETRKQTYSYQSRKLGYRKLRKQVNKLGDWD